MVKGGRHRFGRGIIESIVESAAERLSGDFLLVGGAWISLALRSRRMTEDIDLVGFRGTARERYQLIELATALRLPIESINSAADYFVKRIDGWKQELVLLRKGPRARIFRPTTTLFIRLKLSRLSEQDLRDCAAVIRATARGDLEPIDWRRVSQAIARLPKAANADVSRRREQLSRIIERFARKNNRRLPRAWCN